MTTLSGVEIEDLSYFENLTSTSDLLGVLSGGYAWANASTYSDRGLAVAGSTSSAKGGFTLTDAKTNTLVYTSVYTSTDVARSQSHAFAFAISASSQGINGMALGASHAAYLSKR
ncbi:MAG: hypothetical protein SNJ50_05405 [Cyanobacteriota bacterium]